jgi:hypothetical protein
MNCLEARRSTMPHKMKKNNTDVVNLSGDSSSQYSENRLEQLSENAAQRIQDQID